jgi:uncharacterized protein (TIGR00255 family)
MSPGPKSMTGYAEARAEYNGGTVRLILRSVNHRFLDLHVRLPDGFEFFEPRLREQLRGRLRRGHVDVILRYEATGGAAVQINREVVTAYLRAAEELRGEFGFAAGPDMAGVLRLPGAIAAAAVPLDEAGRAALSERLAACLEEALGRLDQMRAAEGRALAEEMRKRLTRIAECARRVGELSHDLRPAYARRLETRLKELLAGSPLDPARVAQEAAVLADRSDIREELVRLASHVRQFEQMLSTPGDVGKKLDFLLQEMQREANTMLSKTPGGAEEGLEITGVALEVKSEIEKLREQVQNVE